VLTADSKLVTEATMWPRRSTVHRVGLLVHPMSAPVRDQQAIEAIGPSLRSERTGRHL